MKKYDKINVETMSNGGQNTSIKAVGDIQEREQRNNQWIYQDQHS